MVGKILVIGNEKGGTGKTTVSVNLAALAAAAGHDVVLVDADAQQQSAARWADRRAEMHSEANPVRCVGLTGRKLGAGLEDLARRYGVVVVDTGAQDSPELRAAALVASTLVIPFQPEPADLWTLPTMEAMAEKARGLNPALRVIAVVNRIPHQNREAAVQDVEGWMRENVPDLAPAAVVPLVGRTAYGRAFGEGMAVAEAARRDGKAVVEMGALFEEVMR